MIESVFSFFAGAIAFSAFTFYWCKKHHERQSLTMLSASHSLTGALDLQLAAMSTQCGELQDKLTHAQADAAKQRGLAKLHMDSNEMFDKQAQDAWKHHREYGLRAGNAQAWLFRELENAVRLINRYKAEKGEAAIEVNPQLVSMLAEIKRELSEA